MNHEKGVACVVTDWNGGQRILTCLRALRESEGVSVHLIVVDNGSSDGSPDAVKEEFPDVEVIAMGENAGLAKARNQGARRALRAGFSSWMMTPVWGERRLRCFRARSETPRDAASQPRGSLMQGDRRGCGMTGAE